MELHVVGINHKSAPVEVREKAAFTRGEIPGALKAVAAHTGIVERLLLSTCNRTELYGAGEGCPAQMRRILQGLRPQARWDGEHVYHLERTAAVRHLLRVASGLDSQIIGESEILGQVREAYRIASEGSHTGRILDLAFHVALMTGRRVRNETKIGAGTLALPYVAAQRARTALEASPDPTALLVGVGEAGRLAALHLRKRFAGRLLIANRTRVKAEALAADLGARAVPFESIGELLGEVDVVISCTDSPGPVLARSSLPLHRGRPLVVVDMAVPRDVEPAVGEVPGVQLCNLDDLGGEVAENLAFRRGEVPAAERIVEESLAGLERRFGELGAGPPIAEIAAEAERIRLEILESARARFPCEYHEALEELTQRLTARLVQWPIAGREIIGGALADRQRHDRDRQAGDPLLRNGSGDRGGVPVASQRVGRSPIPQKVAATVRPGNGSAPTS